MIKLMSSALFSAKVHKDKVIKDKERELNILEALQESLNYTDQNIENNILLLKII